MRMYRVQFRIRSVIVGIAIVAVLLSVPVRIWLIIAALAWYLLLFGIFLAALVVVPALIAPRERRIEAGYWALALHPLLLLLWLSVWRPYSYPDGISPYDRSPLTTILLTAPYAMAYFSRFYMPVLGALGCALSAYRFRQRSITMALSVLLVAWIATFIIVNWDPFDIRMWFWD